MQTGLYQELVDNKKIIFHEQEEISPLQKVLAYIVIRPTSSHLFHTPTNGVSANIKVLLLPILRSKRSP